MFNIIEETHHVVDFYGREMHWIRVLNPKYNKYSRQIRHHEIENKGLAMKACI